MALAVAVPAEGAAPAEAAAPDRFNGVFVLDSKRSDPISPVLKELGVPWIARKMADSSSVTLTLHRSGDDFTSESKNFFRTQTQRMRLNGGPMEWETPMGDKVVVRPRTEADGAIVVESDIVDGGLMTSTYRLIDGGAVLHLVMLVTRGGVEVARANRYLNRQVAAA